MMVVGGIFLLVGGVLMLCFPDTVYEIAESWKNGASGEASDLYRVHTRVGGAVFLLVGIAGLVVYFVL